MIRHTVYLTIALTMFAYAPTHTAIWQAPIDAENALKNATPAQRNVLENLAKALILTLAANNLRKNTVMIMIFPPPPQNPHTALNKALLDTLGSLRENAPENDVIIAQRILAKRLTKELEEYQSLWEPTYLPYLNFKEPVQEETKYYVYKLIIKAAIEGAHADLNAQIIPSVDQGAAQAIQRAYDDTLKELLDNANTNIL